MGNFVSLRRCSCYLRYIRYSLASGEGNMLWKEEAASAKEGGKVGFGLLLPRPLGGEGSFLLSPPPFSLSIRSESVLESACPPPHSFPPRDQQASR